MGVLLGTRPLFPFTICFFFCSVLNAATVTLTVGASGGTHTTILAAHNACTTAVDNYIIEIKSNYVLEGLPIVLTQKTNSGVVIRPQTGVSGLSLSTGTATYVFQLSGVDNLTIDGRPGGSGAGDMLIENTQTAAARNAVRFENDATNNSVKYCTIKGSSTGGTIYLAGTTGTTGNDNNTIDNCTVTRSGVNFPVYAINAVGSVTKDNDNITISNCNVLDYTTYGIYVQSNTTDWTIINNSFYQSGAYTPTALMSMVYVNAGTNHTVSGNYFGGQAAACGGGAYTLNSSAFYLTPINFRSTVTAGTCTVESNTIRNINITYTAGASAFRAMYIDGAADYIIGSGLKGNVIGDSVSGTGSIVIIPTAAATAAYTFAGIIVQASGTNMIEQNYFGSITINGAGTGTQNKNIFIEVLLNAGPSTIRYNKIGNVTAANISIAATANTYRFIGINYPSDANGTISFNTFQNLSLLSSAVDDAGHENGCIIITGLGNYSVNSNTIGSTVNNNIVFATNGLIHGIWFKNASGTFTCDNNIVQEFNLTSTGTSSQFHGICTDNTGVLSMSRDTVRNIDIAGTAPVGSEPSYVGLRTRSGLAGQLITLSAVKNMTQSAAGADVNMAGIYNALGCTGSITRCHVSGNVVLSTNAGARNTGIFYNSTGSWDISNNVVLLDNGGNTSPLIVGIDCAPGGGTPTVNVYHNSVKIYGTATSGSSASAAFQRSSFGASITTTMKNNVWQNIRTNGGTATAKHYASYIFQTGGTQVYDYNYLETLAAPIAFWNGTGDLAAIANWRTSSGASANEITGSVSIENVRGYTGNAPVPGNGLAYGPVPQDKVFCNRATGVAPAGPWIGAWECNPATLPVEMLNFKGECEGSLVLMSWTTASETNNDHFSIERSVNGKEFKSIGKVYGAGNSSVVRSYEFVDNESQSDKILFYRIRQVDFNGQYEYFGPISIRCSSDEITVTPTVSEGIYFITGDLHEAEISVHSMLGEKLASGTRTTTSAIDISSQPSGIYFVKVVTPYGCKIQKVFKK